MATDLEHLIAGGEFKQILDLLKRQDRLTDSEYILTAWAEFELGDAAAAFERARRLVDRKLHRDDKARCLCVLGRSICSLGTVGEGLVFLRKATTTAGSKSAQAETLAHYVTSALSWVGVEPALAELPRLRRLALEAAHYPALIEYHILFARVAALKGWWSDIDREVSAAQHLLSSHPHIRLEWRLQQLRSSVAIMFGDIDTAVVSAEICLSIATKSGSRSSRAATLANLAYIKAVAGDFELARKLVEQTHELLEANNLVRFATIATGISIAIGADDFHFGHQMVSMGENIASADEPSFYQLSYILQRVKWLIRCRDFDTAFRIASEALTPIDRLADVELLDRMRLLAAEALYGSGRRDEAHKQFAGIATGSRHYTVEMLAERGRVEAILVTDSDPTKASHKLSASWRLLNASSLHGPRIEIERCAERQHITLTNSSEISTRDGTFAGGLSRAESICRLRRYPRASAHEVFDVVATSGLVGWARLLEYRGEQAETIATYGRSGVVASNSIETFEVRGRGLRFLVEALPVDASAFASVRNSVNFLRMVSEPLAAPSEDAASLRSWEATATVDGGMVIGGQVMRDVVNVAHRIAPSSITVLITGETGTGKELLARAVHDASPRHEKPFVPFNCSAVARDMLDAQLFGYRRGAFTGAADAFPGVIRAATGGTLFLDEIGEIPLDVQPKLLRFLESGDIHPLGEPKPVHVDVRVVAATNANLEQLVEEGRFREDLFYRLNVVRLQVPALRERREEVPPLVQHFVDKYSREMHKTDIRVADETLEYLVLYRWPGNVRQLANELRRIVAFAESGTILMPEHLSDILITSRRTVPPSERPLATTEFVVRMDQPMSAAIEHLERSMIQYALKLSRGRVEDAAERLGLSRKGLYLKRQRLHIDTPTSSGDSATRH